MFRKLIIVILFSLSAFDSTGQFIDSVSFRINPRLSFYSFEERGEILLHVPQNLQYNTLTVNILTNNDTLGNWSGIPGKKIIRIPVKLSLVPSVYRIMASISTAGKAKYMASGILPILEYKSNEVKTDRLTGGLIVNRKQFFPFGFYCYSPVNPSLPEEEVVKGFNVMSPYQKILPATFAERKAYMDRCASLGMKVHYNLLSVSGGGGVGSEIEGLTYSEKKKRLISEILAFRDHPALLGWYVADEPNGYGIPPDTLIRIYNTVKTTDPWHPVSIVFMAPYRSAEKYSDALDIVMADPYPVPTSPITLPGNVAGQLSETFSGLKPVWIVPQAFGGGELWEREPTIQEIRTMTYQSLIRGARGIQYFVRQGLNLFPKSVPLWAECGRMAVEVAELTPWLLSDEQTIPVRSASPGILVSSHLHDDQLVILAVNTSNAPQRADISISTGFTGRARVLFENRNINVNSGYIADQLSAYGSQAYLIRLKPSKDTVKTWPGNLLSDPGFEDNSSPGVPSACYARGNGERGATYFTDTREHAEGNHSVRLVTPRDNSSIRLRFFPVNILRGQNYTLSVWAKTDPEQMQDNKDQSGLKFFEIALGEYGKGRFQLTGEWKQFVTNVTIPYDGEIPNKVNMILQMPSAGVAWFDVVQVVKSYDINRSINPELSQIFN